MFSDGGCLRLVALTYVAVYAEGDEVSVGRVRLLAGLVFFCSGSFLEFFLAVSMYVGQTGLME